MITQKEVLAGLFGAYRLARLDVGGMDYFDKTLRGFWRSFYAGVLIAPMFFLLLLVDFMAGEQTISAVRFFTIQGVAFVIALFIFPLVMINVTDALDRTDKYLGYIVAYNWAQVWQNLVFISFVILAQGGVIPPSLALPLQVLILLAIMAYSWFVARTALDLTTGMAIAIVAIEWSLAIFVNWITKFPIVSG